MLLFLLFLSAFVFFVRPEPSVHLACRDLDCGVVKVRDYTNKDTKIGTDFSSTYSFTSNVNSVGAIDAYSDSADDVGIIIYYIQMSGKLIMDYLSYENGIVSKSQESKISINDKEITDVKIVKYGAEDKYVICFISKLATNGDVVTHSVECFVYDATKPTGNIDFNDPIRVGTQPYESLSLHISNSLTLQMCYEGKDDNNQDKEFVECKYAKVDENTNGLIDSGISNPNPKAVESTTTIVASTSFSDDSKITTACYIEDTGDDQNQNTACKVYKPDSTPTLYTVLQFQAKGTVAISVINLDSTTALVCYIRSNDYNIMCVLLTGLDTAGLDTAQPQQGGNVILTPAVDVSCNAILQSKITSTTILVCSCQSCWMVKRDVDTLSSEPNPIPPEYGQNLLTMSDKISSDLSCRSGFTSYNDMTICDYCLPGSGGSGSSCHECRDGYFSRLLPPIDYYYQKSKASAPGGSNFKYGDYPIYYDGGDGTCIECPRGTITIKSKKNRINSDTLDETCPGLDDPIPFLTASKEDQMMGCECNGYWLGLREHERIYAYVVLSFGYLVLVFLNIFTLPDHYAESLQKIGSKILTNTLIPAGENITTAVYILSSPIAEFNILVAMICYFLSSTLVFLWILLRKRILCKFYILQMPEHTYNTLEYDDIFKVIVSVTMALPFIVINAPFLVPQLLAGWLLHCYKCLHLRQTYNFWVTLYTGTEEYEIDTIFDRRIHNESMIIQSIIQSVPMFLLIVFNSILIHRITPSAVISLIFSGLMILNTVHKLVWYKLYLGGNVIDAKVGFEDDVHDRMASDNDDAWNDYINEVEMGRSNNTSKSATKRNLNKKSKSMNENFESPSKKSMSLKRSKTNVTADSPFESPLNSSFSRNPLMERSRSSSSPSNNSNNELGNSKRRIEKLEMNMIGMVEEIKTIKSTVGKGFFGVQESIQNLTSSQDKTNTKVRSLRDNQLRLMEKLEKVSLLRKNSSNRDNYEDSVIDDGDDETEADTIQSSLFESTV